MGFLKGESLVTTSMSLHSSFEMDPKQKADASLSDCKRRGQTWQERLDRQDFGVPKEPPRSLEARFQASLSESRGDLEREMDSWTAEEISQCWASTQGVIRALRRGRRASNPT